MSISGSSSSSAAATSSSSSSSSSSWGTGAGGAGKEEGLPADAEAMVECWLRFMAASSMSGRPPTNAGERKERKAAFDAYQAYAAREAELERVLLAHKLIALNRRCATCENCWVPTKRGERAAQEWWSAKRTAKTAKTEKS